MNSGYIWLAVFVVIIPCIVLSQIVTMGTGMERLMRCIRHQDKRMADIIADYSRCAQERNRLFRLVHWSIGTTEAAISMSDEYGADEEDVADAKDHLREMKIAIGLNPDLDLWEQDPKSLARVDARLQWKEPS